MQNNKKILLIIEFIIIFFITPIVIYLFRRELAFKIVPLVLLMAICCLIYLKKDENFDKKKLFNTKDIKTHLKRIFLSFIIPALLLSAITYFYLNSRFMAFPQELPVLWLVVMFLYPILAAYPQELIFRTFFFHRYKGLFSNTKIMIFVNAVCFGIAHSQYSNPVAPVLSGLGGILFAYRYLKSDSLLVVSLEHALWGNFLFTIGLGWYFYSGAIK